VTLGWNASDTAPGAKGLLTPRERVQIVATRQEVRPCPYQLDMTAGADQYWASYFGRSDYLRECVGNHLLRVKHKRHLAVYDDRYVDLFGVTWMLDPLTGGMGMVGAPLLHEASLNDYRFPQPDEAMVRELCGPFVDSDLFRIYEIGLSLFERAWSLRGMEQLLCDFHLEPAFAHALLGRITDYNLQVIDFAAGFGADCVLLGDDWGQQRGLIMGPDIWRKFIKPCVKRLYERIRAHGMLVCQHSCGDNREIISDLVSMGLSIYNTFQPEIYDAAAFAKQWGRELTVYGGISTQRELRYGTPGEVRDAARRMLDILGPCGYILAPTHQITLDMPGENILALIDVMRDQTT